MGNDVAMCAVSILRGHYAVQLYEVSEESIKKFFGGFRVSWHRVDDLMKTGTVFASSGIYDGSKMALSVPLLSFGSFHCITPGGRLKGLVIRQRGDRSIPWPFS